MICKENSPESRQMEVVIKKQAKFKKTSAKQENHTIKLNNCSIQEKKIVIAGIFKFIPLKFVANSYLKGCIPCSKRSEPVSWGEDLVAITSIFATPPVSNYKWVTVLGHCKSNFSSLLNHRLIQVTFFYLFMSDLRSIWFYYVQNWAKCKK